MKKKKALELLKKIDWSELRTQKTLLFKLASGTENYVTLSDIVPDIEGLISLIDSIQDFAVDVLDIDEMHVFDLDEEEMRENETPEIIFARENADLIFEMHIEGTALYEDEVPEEFVNKIVDNEPHPTIIKSKIMKSILHDLKENPDSFSRDENNKLTYDSSMYDYGFAIISYCEKQWKKEQKKLKKQTRKIIGFQVVDNNNELHPEMEGSFCLYNAEQTIRMLRNTDKEWKVVAIYDGDVEEPTYCFTGSPLKYKK